MMNKILIGTKVIAIMLIAVSCVGTVKDKNAALGNIVSNGAKTDNLSFNGLTQANPISHDKVELTFFPAKGDQNNLTYEIYINGSPTPIKISGKSLPINSKGSMSTTITGLTINTSYNFNMKVTQTGTASTSLLDPTKSLTATTFSNETADFLGISSVTLGAGEAGKHTVIVKWLPAKSTGSSISPKANDPVAYEVKYISQAGGIGNLNNPSYNGTERVILQNPTVLGTSPSLSTDSQMIIGGLTSGVNYYFQVRAIHKNFVLFNSDKNYKREANTKYLAIKTLDSAGLFDFPVSQVKLANPSNVDARTQLDVSWSSAIGSFDHYRVCSLKVANADNYYQAEAPAGTPINKIVPEDDKLLNIPAFSAVNDCTYVSPDLNYFRLVSLEEYAYFQVKVYACKTANCDYADRIASDVKQIRVKASVTPFGGINEIRNPSSETELSTITASFDPPIMTSGFMNKMSLYCYSSSTDANPVLIPVDGTPSNFPGKSQCHKIRVPTTWPITSDDFGLFNEIKIDLPQLTRDGIAGIDGVKKYCFSLVPSIQSAFLTQEDKINASIKCFTPQVKTPNIMEFPGRDIACNIIGKSIQINWPIPTGGLFSKFAVFYQEKITGAEFFNYQKAIAEYNAGTPIEYKWIDNIDKSFTNQPISTLFPGRKYNIGVIPYLIDGAQKLWAQANFNTGECALPLPKANFNEWMDVIALGPKEDGLTPPSPTLKRKYLLETLNDDSLPVEIKLKTSGNFIDPDDMDPLASTRESADLFDGVYGRYDWVDTNPAHQYSNSGIVKISWQDVTFYSGADLEYMSDRVQSYEPAAQKNARKFGYKVYRSDDNKLTWIDLTQNSTKNSNQSLNNSGLIHSNDYTWRKTNSSLGITNKVSSFTDYSVRFSGYSGDTDRARVYYYKIVSVFDGKELQYDPTGSNASHHIIKVTLPPRNMALVHRMIANRTICNEMDKAIRKGSNEFYACTYDGVASSGLAPPYAKGNTVYDVGGDVFIDRFELGVPFTRGDRSNTNSNSAYTGTKSNFDGKANNGNNFVGCYNDPTTNQLYEPSQGPNKGSAYLNNELAPGDCIGNDKPILASDKSTVCSDPTKTSAAYYWWPGSPGGSYVADCTTLEYNGEILSDLSKLTSPLWDESKLSGTFIPTRGEFGAIYFMRASAVPSVSYGIIRGMTKFPAANSQKVVLDYNSRNTNAFINLPYIDAIGRLIPRWLTLNSLFGRLSLVTAANAVVPNSVIDLYNKTVSEVLSNTKLYDNTNVKAPVALTTSTRYDKNTTKLARIFTSNASKLPPAQGLSQLQLHKVCSTYKIQVGYESSTSGFKPLGLEKSKRLMRKKESTVAAAWPQTYDNAKVNDLEKGVSAKSCNGKDKINLPGTTTLQKQSKISVLSPSAGRVRPYILSGSSSLDQDGDYSTEACVSRFGIQDIVGNMSENNSDVFFCDFSIPKVKIGPTSDPANSALYDIGVDSTPFDNSTNTWVESAPESGACSSVEIGGDRTGLYENGGPFNPIYKPDGITLNTPVFSSNSLKVGIKKFDQDSVLSSRNGDGSFLDFGANNLAPVLGNPNAFQSSYADYFSVPLGLPLTCQQGCNGTGNGGDNKRIISDKRTAQQNYILSDLGTGALIDSVKLDFPTNNATFTNVGVDEISRFGNYNTGDPDSTPMNYYTGVVNVNANPSLNTKEVDFTVPGSGIPGTLYQLSWKISRSSYMRFTTGGSNDTDPSRYTFLMDGPSELDENYISSRGGRCAIMIEEEE